jgi:phage terminase large subunit GpA-like protein
MEHLEAFDPSEVWSERVLPPRNITVSQWADENRVLTGTASAERGQWATRPYQREPMDVLSPSHPCREVVLLSAAQMMKTEVILNFLGYIADVDPGPVLVVEPRAEDAKALSKDRVGPMFASTPCLRDKIAAVKSRDSNNTTMHKVFANGAGHITFTGAISPSGLAMRPIRYVLLDEVDRYPASAGSEGDPVSLAIKRTLEFERNRKIVLASTPTIKGISRIELAWRESDQREWEVPCPFCGHYQALVLGDGSGPGLVWPEGKPEEAMYRCAGCQQLIPHHRKAQMVAQGMYVARNPESLIPGFKITQLISPKKNWGAIATEFLAAKKSPETLKAFMNTVLAELWEDKHEVPTDAHALWSRCEPYEAEVPAGVTLLTAGVDVQADRLEIEIVGWGRDEESWSIAQHVIPGDTSGTEVWDQLECLLQSEYQHASGVALRIVCCCVDTGFKDATVLAFTRDRYRRRVYAIKGHAGEHPIWPRVPSKKNNTPFFMIGVDPAKSALYDRLRIDQPGPGYCHFPLGRDIQYFEQLTAERMYTRFHNGFPKREWRKESSVRNEALDCRVYAYAALFALYAAGLKLDVHCDRFAGLTGTRRSAPAAPTAEPAPEGNTPAPAPASQGSGDSWRSDRREEWIPKRKWF